MGIKEPAIAAIHQNLFRVATVREKVLENEIFSRSGKSQGITFSVREIKKKRKKSWKSQGISKFS